MFIITAFNKFYNHVDTDFKKCSLITKPPESQTVYEQNGMAVGYDSHFSIACV